MGLRVKRTESAVPGILVENDTDYRTDDIQALIVAACEHNKGKKRRYPVPETIYVRVVEWRGSAKRGVRAKREADDLLRIEIQPVTKIRQSVIDKIGAIEDPRAPKEIVGELAKWIVGFVTSNYIGHTTPHPEWAAAMSLRVASKPERFKPKVYAKRLIEHLTEPLTRARRRLERTQKEIARHTDHIAKIAAEAGIEPAGNGASQP